MTMTGPRSSTLWRFVSSPWTWGLISLLETSTALGEPAILDAGLAPLIGTSGNTGPDAYIPWSGFSSSPAQIVSGGVLPFHGSCQGDPACSGMKVVQVHDATTDALIPGRLEVSEVQFGEPRAYFVPDIPFEVGDTLLVRDALRGGFNEFRVEVVPQTSLTMDSLRIDVSLTRVRTVLRTTCCQASNFAPRRCIASSELNEVAFDVVLSEGEPVAAQYVFELELRDATTQELLPLVYPQIDLTVSPITARAMLGTVQSACYKVSARPIRGGESVELESDCVATDWKNLGMTERSSAELERWLATCEVVEPDSGVPDVDVDADAGTDASATQGSEDASRSMTVFTKHNTSGCQLASGGSSGGSGLLWALGLFLWTRRRGRTLSLLALSTLASLTVASPALAKPAPPRNPASGTAPDRAGGTVVPPQIPAGGVLPFLGACMRGLECPILDGVTVLDTLTATPVAGHVETVMDELAGPRAYFVPDEPFAVGARLSVADENYQTFYGQMFEVEVVAPVSLTAASIQVQTSLSKHRTVLRNTCCPSLTTARPRCIAAAERTGVMFSATMTAADVSATQYFFQLHLRASLETDLGRPSADYQPVYVQLPTNSLSEFAGSSPSYCYTVRALPVTGGEAVELDAKCFDNTVPEIGRKERTEAELERWLLTCETLPEETDDAGFDEADPDETESDAGRDATVKPEDSATTADTSGQSDGCQLAGVPTWGGGMGWMSMGVLLWTRRSRRRVR